MITARAFSPRHYAVFGLARTGLSVVAALRGSGATVTVWDDDAKKRAAIEDVQVHVADLNTADLSAFDGIVVSPGVPLNTHPLAARAAAAGVAVLGDIELFAQARDELPPHKVVGITGTNGKSTTTALVHHILAQAGVPTTMGGNIGLPILSQDALPDGGVYVLELSSFQIDLTQSLACDVAILTNITPDHLDRYDGMAGYAASKERLFDMQTDGGAAIFVSDDTETAAIAKGRGGVPVSFSDVLADGVSFVNGAAYADGEAIGYQADWPSLAGPHNAQNAVAAIAAARVLGLDAGVIRAGLETYPGLPHRMERVAEIGGVLYVNDSKATNPTSTAPALAAYPAIHWIVGGKRKTDELDACMPYLGHVRAAYVIGEAETVYAHLLGAHVPVIRAATVERATQLAAGAAKPGEVVLLSPACASYDQFRDFEQRGDVFKAAVQELGA
ncbi:UDP-N-acetylmuramoyl-L-alanine--D-glutamate ligase [Sphingosinicella soli]|uniref:UDP-N-acetylmuramoylalanine--D-glutamate ligase n=1 Tax=Sphingosinicella soli TaxID=333708 RepID=A0A7W7F8N0_9SPHN|nr:UDP-N-acetylmuramoyl-L-alanine--D-glutamate ligase [Sphingosinicella soli]MBB4631823.1 UDP-N-acetylmuramoylalanine--D-glutamate ligase [Sphingosinicella soli]